MRRVLVPVVLGIFQWATVASGGQGTGALLSTNSAPRLASITAQNCGDAAHTATAAGQSGGQDLSAQAAARVTERAVAFSHPDANLPAANSQADATILGQRPTDLSTCVPAVSALVTPQAPAQPCPSEQILNFQMTHQGDEEREIPIWRIPGNTAFFYEAGMTIDADGAPNAYHPDNTGLDDLANAGAPGSWEGLAKNADGEPFVQGPDDPFPGYYVSATALADRTKPPNDPTRYVDASKIPFIVLPGGMAREIGARPGDFALVVNRRNGKSSYAIFGDVGPSDRIGEGSVALAENLGIRSDARNGGARGGVFFLVFPGSGNGRPRSVDEINSETAKLLELLGGMPQLTACPAQ